MSISPIGASGSQALDRSASVTSRSTPSTSQGAFSTDSADTSSVSGPGNMLNKLKSLLQSDPEKFRQVVADISEALTSSAESSQNEQEKTMLTDMAGKFAAAGQTGDLSGLAPPQVGAKGPPPAGGPSKGGAPPAGAAPSGSPASSGTSTAESIESTAIADPADTNSDGKVSDKERQAYEAKRAKAQEMLNPSVHQAYGQRAQADGTDPMAKLDSIVSKALESAA